MQFIKALMQIKPNEKGLKYVKTESFGRTCQTIAHDMLSVGKTWDQVDVQLRYNTTVAIMPRRRYDSDEIADFYTRNFKVIDAAWLPAVLRMKQDFMEMEKNPKQWLRDHGLFPQSPTGL